jgi:sigma-B regulation protein RsbU (phosphoserine phosphatase)
MIHTDDSAAHADRLRGLSAFAGDSAQALRALHQHLAHAWPDCALALALTREAPPGQCRLAGLIAADGTELLRANDPLGLRARLPSFDDALTACVFAKPRPNAFDLDARLRATPLAQALRVPAALLALPMLREGQYDHWLLLASNAHGRFDHTPLTPALTEATLAYTLLARPLDLRVLAAAAQRQHRAIEGLAEVQRLLLPDNPQIAGLEFAVHWQPAETAAGDYYDLMSLSPIQPEFDATQGDAWGVMLGDVSGHGAAAAMEAAQFDAILRTYRGDEAPLGAGGALTYANRHFFSRRQRPHFLTMFAAGARPDRRELTYVNAGHAPALLRQDGRTRWIGKDEDASIPLGVLRDHRWENFQAPWHPGDALVLYTDGIVEARDAQGRAFGAQRMYDLIANAPPEPEAMIARVRDALFEHQGSTIGVDDQSMIVLRQREID